MKILALVPTYNEKENIEILLRSLFSLPLDLHVLVVDDLSPDGTGQIVEELKSEFPGQLEIMHRQGPRGRGRAGIAAFQAAAKRDEFAWIAEMDADGSHDPKYLPSMIEAGSQADVVLGSRYVKGGGVVGWSAFRHLNSWVAGNIARVILGLRVKDVTSGYRIFRHEVVQKLPWDRMISDNPSIVEEILYYCVLRGCRITETPITFVDRERGKSKFSIRFVGRWILNLWQVRRKAKHE